MTDKVRHNEPSAPVNTRQHLVGQQPDVTEGAPKAPAQASVEAHEETMQGLDPAAPHPAEEGKPYAARHPGGAHPPSPNKDLGPNPAVHDGEAPPRPHNAGSGPE